MLAPDAVRQGIDTLFANIDGFFNRGNKVVDVSNQRWRGPDGKLVPATAKVGRCLHKDKKSRTARRSVQVTKPLGINMAKWELADVVRSNGVELHIVFRSRNWPTAQQSGRPLPGRMLQPEQRTPTKNLDPPRLQHDKVKNVAYVAQSRSYTGSDPGVKTVMTKAFYDAGALKSDVCLTWLRYVPQKGIIS